MDTIQTLHQKLIDLERNSNVKKRTSRQKKNMLHRNIDKILGNIRNINRQYYNDTDRYFIGRNVRGNRLSLPEPTLNTVKKRMINEAHQKGFLHKVQNRFNTTFRKGKTNARAQNRLPLNRAKWGSNTKKRDELLNQYETKYRNWASSHYNNTANQQQIRNTRKQRNALRQEKAKNTIVENFKKYGYRYSPIVNLEATPGREQLEPAYYRNHYVEYNKPGNLPKGYPGRILYEGNWEQGLEQLKATNQPRSLD